MEQTGNKISSWGKMCNEESTVKSVYDINFE